MTQSASDFPGREWLKGGLQRARASLWLRGADRVGQQLLLDGRPFVQNLGALRIGDRVRIASRPVQSHLVVGKGATLEIRDDVRISYGAAISAYARVDIGARARIGPFVVVMDSDFHVAGDRSAAAQAHPVRIGEGVTIESRVTILRGSSIGAGARIRSGSVVSGHIPEGALAAGVPASVWSDEPLEPTLDVRQVVMRALNLPALPQLSDGPDQIPQWDSFGALKLLLTLEKTFQVTIREDAIRSARSLADLARIIDTAAGR